MSSKLVISPAVFQILLAGCSGGNFDVVTSPDASVDETGADSALAEDTSDTATADSTLDSGLSADTAMDSATDSAADSSPTDSCTVNACGGCTALSNKPGDACGSCGTWTCGSDKESVVCKDPGKNGCGGCTPLAAKPGDVCGVGCGGGTYTCKGTDALECSGATTVNACGGCGVLDHALGSACGVCGSAKYACDSSDPTKNKTVCPDPVSTPAPNTGCGGKCGTAKYACSSDGKSTACVDPLASAATPDTPCAGGRCDGAKWKCSTDKTAITCVDPVPSSAPAVGSSCGGVCGSATNKCTNPSTIACVDPVPSTAAKPGDKCGICGTSTTACNVEKTDVSCLLDDDRGKQTSPNNVVTAALNIEARTNRYTQLAVPFSMTGGNSRVASVKVLLSRSAYACMYYEDSGGICHVFDPDCVCNCTTGSCTVNPTGPDTLKLELVAGTPSAPGTVLDTATVTPTDVPLDAMTYPFPPPTTTTTFTFSNKTVKLATGTKVFVRLVTSGGGNQYLLWGIRPTTSSTVRVVSSESAKPWSDANVEPYFVVTQSACF